MSAYKTSMVFHGWATVEMEWALWNGMSMFIGQSEELCDGNGLGIILTGRISIKLEEETNQMIWNSRFQIN